MDELNARKVWLETIERVKDQTLHPSLWRALEASHGITLEDDVFIIGFKSQDFPQAGLLRSSEHRSIIEKTLARLLGRPEVKLKTIEGSTMSDYLNVKRQEALFEAQRKMVMEQKAAERATVKSWDNTLEAISRLYAKTYLRQLPHIRAKYMQQALKMISEAMDANYEGSERDDIAERALARAIDKVATLIEAPSVYVAAELMRIRGELDKGVQTEAPKTEEEDASGTPVALPGQPPALTGEGPQKDGAGSGQ